MHMQQKCGMVWPMPNRGYSHLIMGILDSLVVYGSFRFVMTGYPQFSSILDGDFPWNKPSSVFGVSIFIWLVVSTPLKNISQLGWLFPIYGKIKLMFQTTNQLWKAPYEHPQHGCKSLQGPTTLTMLRATWNARWNATINCYQHTQLDSTIPLTSVPSKHFWDTHTHRSNPYNIGFCLKIRYPNIPGFIIDVTIKFR